MIRLLIQNAKLMENNYLIIVIIINYIYLLFLVAGFTENIPETKFNKTKRHFFGKPNIFFN